MEKLNAFFAPMTQEQIDEFLYTNSVRDIAVEAEVTPDEVRAWLTSYMAEG